MSCKCMHVLGGMCVVSGATLVAASGGCLVVKQLWWLRVGGWLLLP